jgi:hypothetical protein
MPLCILVLSFTISERVTHLDILSLCAKRQNKVRAPSKGAVDKCGLRNENNPMKLFS